MVDQYKDINISEDMVGNRYTLNQKFYSYRLMKLENNGYLDRQLVKEQSKKKTAYSHIRRSDIEDVVQKLSYSDWLVLFYLAQSMEKGNFGELLARLATDIQEEYKYASDEEAAAMRPLNKGNV